MSPTRFASEHRWIYVGAIVVLVGMLITGILVYTQQHHNIQANKKAQELSGQLEAAGYRVPDQDQIVSTLGTSGGAVCASLGSVLKNALWLQNISNGAAGPGQRPVIGDRRAIEVEALILGVYCPDELVKYQDKLEEIKTSDTVKN
ncbi:hypothetical protein AB0D08_15115 [Kitasatospora sp. NPDC048540]|uniref:hypothetical protein n=1 Tax=Kitasatospora sp. NPDC048540 TaxID=3155634 RepID=UPI0033DB4842